MNTLKVTTAKTQLRANAGDELGLLVNLLRDEKIGYRTLLRNVAEIVADDKELMVNAVLILTDKERIKQAEVMPVDFTNAIDHIELAEDFTGKETVIAAIEDAMQRG